MKSDLTGMGYQSWRLPPWDRGELFSATVCRKQSQGCSSFFKTNYTVTCWFSGGEDNERSLWCTPDQVRSQEASDS